MAGKFNDTVVLAMVMVAAAALFHSSQAQTTHVVGDALGWTIPPGGQMAYSTWAARQTFTVGDDLVFNFTTGAHDVAEVNAAALSSCNANNPISISTAGPTSISLNSSGEHHFICTFGQHCSLGQKLSINVSTTSSSPAPQPAGPTPSSPAPSPMQTSTPPPTPSPASTPEATPSPVSTPAPSPAREPQTYIVGDGMGWVVPTGGSVAYQTWAAGKSFTVGDTLVFNFANGSHDVAEVTKSAYGSCNTTATLSLFSTSPTRITLSAAGEHFYICTFTQHCSLGQQLAINVTGSSTTPPSTSTPSPSGSAAPPPPSGNSPPSFATAAFLPVSLLSVALALLY